MEEQSQQIASLSVPVLMRLMKVILDNPEFESVTQNIVESMLTQLGYHQLGYAIIILTLVDEEKQILKRITFSRTETAHQAMSKLPVPFSDIEIPLQEEKNLCIQALRLRCPLHSPQVADVLYPVVSLEQAAPIQEQVGIKTSMVYPIMLQEKPIGVLIFSLTKEQNQIGDDERELLTAFSELVGVAIQISQAYEKEKESVRRERDMLDIMGHELRTPATVIKLAANMLEKEVFEEKPRKRVHEIEETIDQQIDLINKLVNTAKIDNKHFELNVTPTHLDELTKLAVQALGKEAQDKGLTLYYVDHGDVPQVLTDQTRIREVIVNLISNAIKYTPQGQIEVSCFVSGNEVVVSVKDTGEGIAEEERGTLFQKFTRLNNYTKSSADSQVGMVRPGGSGLGLYVSKGVVELHKGRIWVESTLGIGSTFNFALPIPSPEAVAQHNEPQRPGANLFERMKLTQEKNAA